MTLGKQIFSLLEASASPQTSPQIQAEITTHLRKLSHQLKFCSCLLEILQDHRNPSQIRGIAGLVLKNEIKWRAEHIPPEDLHFLMERLLGSIGDPEEFIRKTTAAVAVALYSRLGQGDGPSWPSLFNIIVLGLGSTTDLSLVLGSMSLFRLLCEDYTSEAIEECEGLASAVLSPLFCHAANRESAKLRNSAFACINQLIYSKPAALTANLGTFMGILSEFAGCQESTKEICTCLSSLVECYSQELESQMSTIMEFMLVSLGSPAYDVAFEACEFWLSLGEMEVHYSRITAVLPRLIPGLLRCMPYGEEDLEVLQEAADDCQSNYSHSAASSSKEGQEEEEEDDDQSTVDEDQDMEWNLRRCAASTLDLLSNVLDSSVMIPILLSSLQPMLSNSTDWKSQEAAILAIGAVSEGGLGEMKPHLGSLIPWLLQVLIGASGVGSNLLKSIICWTLGRYSIWIVESGTFYSSICEALAFQIANSKHSKLQASATTALLALMEEPDEKKAPIIPLSIQNALIKGILHFKHPNRILLYNAIGTLAEKTSSPFDDSFLPCLLGKWPSTADDLELIPLVECIGNLIPKCANGILYAKSLYDRALQMIRIPDADPDLIFTAFDLLDSLIRAGFFQYFDGAFTELLLGVFSSPHPSVRQSAFGALGDVALCGVASFAQSIIQANRNKIDQAIMLNLDPQVGPPVTQSVANNAIWALGVIYISSQSVGHAIEEHTPLFIGVLVSILERSIGGKGLRISRALLENAAIAYSRIGAVAPEIAASRVESVIRANLMRWISGVSDPFELEQSLWGILQITKADGTGLIKAHVKEWRQKIDHRIIDEICS